MGLNDFTVKEGRPLPVLILADVSGSMQGEKINLLNVSLREMVSALAGIDDVRGSFQVGIITFGEEVKVHQPLTDVHSIKLIELHAGGKTPMGEAFDLVSSIIDDHNQISSRAYTPTIILVSDGQPTDFDGTTDGTPDAYMDWTPLRNLQNSARGSKCLRIGMGIGDDADINMLKAFVNNPEIPVVRSKDAHGIPRFFEWVTMSTVSRINSADPNSVSSMLPLGFDDDELFSL